MSSEPLSIVNPAVGLFQSQEPAMFQAEAKDAGVSFIHSATNMVIRERRLRTRPAWVELKLESAAEGWLESNTQGAVAYDPRIGKPVHAVSGSPGVVELAGGKLWRITPGINSFKVEDISGGETVVAEDRLAFLTQAAPYIICTSRLGNTLIWDGKATSTSTGYTPTQPQTSALPNFAGPLAYTNRIWTAINGTEVIAGNQAASSVENRYTYADLLRTEQQALDITSASFSSPFSLGEIVGMFVVGSYRGGNIPAQSEVYIATQGGGLWSILGGQPRDTWGTTPMVRGISSNTGPTGPYSAVAGIDELVFRSNSGVSSIKTLTQETAAVGNPRIELGQEVLPLLQKDNSGLLIYASAAIEQEQQRLMLTLNPKTDGPHRFHGGYLTAALSPSRSRVPQQMDWEAVSTLPAAMGEIVQFVRVRGSGNPRMFAILRKSDGTKGLAEYTSNYTDDRLADGTLVPIPWQILTRKLMTQGEYTPSAFGDAWISMREVRDKVSVRILARGSEEKDFEELWAGTFLNGTWTLDNGNEFKGLADGEPLNIGEQFLGFNAPWIEILIQGEGCCMFDLALDESGQSSANTETGRRDQLLTGASLCQFDIFRRA